jgi:hypothetical protein
VARSNSVGQTTSLCNSSARLLVRLSRKAVYAERSHRSSQVFTAAGNTRRYTTGTECRTAVGPSLPLRDWLTCALRLSHGILYDTRYIICHTVIHTPCGLSSLSQGLRAAVESLALVPDPPPVTTVGACLPDPGSGSGDPAASGAAVVTRVSQSVGAHRSPVAPCPRARSK